jgi:ribonuclease VapC
VSACLLDASAVLALLQDEAGANTVAQAVRSGAAVVSVNLSEVASKLCDGGLPDDDIGQVLNGLKIEVLGFDADDARIAGLLRRVTRARGLSLGDRACLAVGVRRGLTILTADVSWVGLVPGADVIPIR